MPSRDIKQLERDWEDAYNALEARRERDKRTASAKQIKQARETPGVSLGAYLTPDILARRQELTMKGRTKLVLDYGYNGKTESYSLAELNKMAAALDRADNKFQSSVKGVPAAELVKRASQPIKRGFSSAVQQAKSITASTLYKFEGNILHFRATASGETANAPSHYQVKIRLEEWNRKANMEGQKYVNKARQACFGNVSIDCNCGGYLYPYRYLATIGGFAITPEHVFPKIKNPRLKGCCCKHILKTLIVMQGPVIIQRIAKEMQHQAQSHRASTSDTEKYLRADQVKKMDDAGSTDSAKAFRAFNKAAKAFAKMKEDEQTKRALNSLNPKGKKMELDDATKVKAAEIVIKRMKDDQRKNVVGMLKTLKQIGQMNDDALTNLAKNTGTDKTVLDQIIKEEGL